jgi:hypothetical protein
MELSDKQQRNQLRVDISLTHDQLVVNSGRRSIMASLSLVIGSGAGENRTLLVSSIP